MWGLYHFTQNFHTLSHQDNRLDTSFTSSGNELYKTFSSSDFQPATDCFKDDMAVPDADEEMTLVT